MRRVLVSSFRAFCPKWGAGHLPHPPQPPSPQRERDFHEEQRGGQPPGSTMKAVATSSRSNWNRSRSSRCWTPATPRAGAWSRPTDTNSTSAPAPPRWRSAAAAEKTPPSATRAPCERASPASTSRRSEPMNCSW